MSAPGPLYDLRTVQDLAAAGKVSWVGASHTQAVELGFSTEGAEECIAWLELSEFRKTLTYDNGKSWDDYVAKRKCPASNTMRNIYIKLCIVTYKHDDGTSEEVLVTSFHTEKPI